MEKERSIRAKETLRSVGSVAAEFLGAGTTIGLFERFAEKVSVSSSIEIGVGVGFVVAYLTEEKMRKNKIGRNESDPGE